MTTVSYVALIVVLVAVAATVALRPWPFPPSLTSDELNGFIRQNLAEPGRGTESLSTFYGWRQELWSVLARGLGAFAVALLLALVGASLEDGKTVRTQATGGIAAPQASTMTTTESGTSPEVLALVGGVAILAAGVWLRSRAVQREFARDLGRL